ncbi:hypothetical protein JCM8208_005671 [Rhodotorula glutinis]
MASSPDLISPSSQADIIAGPPVFPQEICNLILEHLEPIPVSVATAVQAESAQRELGYRMQRVCPAWWLGGRRIAWSRFTQFWNGDDYLINGLLTRPHLASEIREIMFQHSPLDANAVNSTSSIPTRRRATLTVVALIEMCSARLEILYFFCPADNLDLWAQATMSFMAATLSKLSLRVTVTDAADLFDLVRGLGELVRLNDLFIVIDGDREWAPSGPPEAQQKGIQSAPTSSLLPVARFTLRHPGALASRLSIAPGEVLASFLDPEQLQSLALEVSERESLDWVGAFRRLRFISLACFEAHRDPTFLPRRHHLDAPCSRKGRPAASTKYSTQLAPSPVSLGRLLDKMPPRIKFYSFGGGVFFVDDIGLPGLPRKQRPRPDVRLKINVKLKGTKVRPVALYRRTEADGTKTWSILPELILGGVKDSVGSLEEIE